MKHLLLIAMALLPTAASAHMGNHSLLNLSAGFFHPLNGLDHFLALLATGVWLAQSNTRGKWAFPALFIAVLALAIPLGMRFTHLTFEGGLVATLVVLGAFMAMGVRGSPGLRAAVVLATAAIHGFVHGTELPTGEGVVAFISGLIGSSLVVIALALVAAGHLSSALSTLPVRLAGAALVVVGIVLSL